jgi:hypothetical protein
MDPARTKKVRNKLLKLGIVVLLGLCAGYVLLRLLVDMQPNLGR